MNREFKVTICGGVVVDIKGLEDGERFHFFDKVLVEMGILSHEEWLAKLNLHLNGNLVLVLLIEGNEVADHSPKSAKVIVESIESYTDPRYLKIAGSVNSLKM